MPNETLYIHTTECQTPLWSAEEAWGARLLGPGGVGSGARGALGRVEGVQGTLRCAIVASRPSARHRTTLRFYYDCISISSCFFQVNFGFISFRSKFCFNFNSN